jgi:hypothetical protein
MKRITLSAAAVALMLTACQDTRNESTKGWPEHFDKTVGVRIDADRGLRWIENFKRTNKGPRHGETYKVSKTNLERLIKSGENILGITFYLGTDDAGIQHIILVPVDGELKGWTGIAIDANTDVEISLETAKAWSENYKASNTGAVTRHSFGLDIFSEIGKYPSFEISQGLDDAQDPELLLIIRNVGTNSVPYIWDGGIQCPPYC